MKSVVGRAKLGGGSVKRSHCRLALDIFVIISALGLHSSATAEEKEKMNFVVHDMDVNKQEAGMIDNPTTRIDLVRNLKYAFDSNMIIDTSFLTAESIKRYLSVDATYYTNGSDGNISGVAFYKSGPTEQMREDETSNTTFYFDRSNSVTGVSVNLSLYVQRFITYDMVIELFGKNWNEREVAITDGTARHGPHPMGGRRIAYEYGQGRRIVVDFTSVGEVDTIDFLVKEH